MISSTLNNNRHRVEHINVFSPIFQQPDKPKPIDRDDFLQPFE